MSDLLAIMLNGLVGGALYLWGDWRGFQRARRRYQKQEKHW